MNPRSNFLRITSCRYLTIWLAAATVQIASAAVRSPPFIIRQHPATDIFFQVAKSEQEGDKPFLIECEAKGNPPPIYRWYKNGTEFKWHDHFDRIYQRSRRGTLVFASPRDEDAGEYQCQARNELGTAITHAVHVRKVETDSRAAIQNIRLVEAKEGEPLKLTCSHSEGLVRAKVFWSLFHHVQGVLILNSSRITVDPKGDLWFSNVTQEDASIDIFYACVTFYRSPNGNESKLQTYALQVIPMNSSVHSPVAQYVTNGTIVALEGDDVEIWCVAGGTPLPQIHWTKENGTLPSHRLQYKNFWKTLRIKKVKLRDAGTYLCNAANGIGTPLVHGVRLEVFGEARECHRVLESDKGTLQIKPSTTRCLWIIKLQNKTGFLLELDPLMTEPILVIPEHNIFDSKLRSVWITGAEGVYGEFFGNILAIAVPPRRERTALNWTGVAPDDSGVAFGARSVNDLEGSLEWEPEGEGIDKVFWAFDVGATTQFNLTLKTVHPIGERMDNCKIMSLAVLEIGPNGNISEIQKTCEGSSMGSVIFGSSSQFLMVLRIKSVEVARSNLKITWRHHYLPPTKSVVGILAGTSSWLTLVTFNSSQTKTVSSHNVDGLAFDWNSRRNYRLESSVGMVRSSLDGSKSETLLSDASSWLFGMAIEPISGNVYYGNRSSRTIRVCNNDVTKCSSVANRSDLDDVWDIAVHPSKGLLFWSSYGGRIYKANLDGSNTTIILTRHLVLGIDVDENEDRLYWGSGRGITSSDLNGHDGRKLPTVNALVADLAINNDNVYYINYNERSILVTSKLGGNSSLVTQSKNPIFHVALFGKRISNPHPNPCKQSQCAHLCIVLTPVSYRCMCPDTQKLNMDGITCNILHT